MPEPFHYKQPVKAGSHNGFVHFWRDLNSILPTDEAVALDWVTEKYHYRLFVRGAETVETLLEMAGQIQ